MKEAGKFMNVLPKAWQNLMSSSGSVPFVVKAIDRVVDAGWFMEPNMHDFFEMMYMKRGDAVFQIEESHVKLGPNNIVIIKPNRRHKLLVRSDEGCEFIVFSFRLVDHETAGFSKASIEDFIDYVEGEGTGSYISLKVSQRNEIIQLLNNIIKEKNNRDTDSEFLLRLMVMETFVHLSRALRIEWENSMKNKSPKLKELIKISVNYINANYEKELTLGDISNFVYLSPSYFTRVFKEEMKVSPISYLLKVRINKAKEILAGTDMKIGDTALAVGFSNHQRFNEIFRKNTGTTPSDFRKTSTAAGN
jgi:AraC-like DNA-binding protein